MIWHSISEYVDIETGEALKKRIAEKYYIIIKKIKHVKREEKRGLITYTNECRRKPEQGNIFNGLP